MQHILLYADSPSWGIVPTTRRRLPFEQRWPGVTEIGLNAGGREKCIGRAETLRETAATLGCLFFDAGSVTPASPRVGVHLDADQHLRLRRAMVAVVASLLPEA